MVTRRATTSSRVVIVVVVVWLLIGLAAAVQRNYFAGSDATCAKVGTTLVTIVAGPLNYIGANPKIDCSVPEPSR
jgi:ABC-type cobalt transport system substrate-binding protein